MYKLIHFIHSPSILLLFPLLSLPPLPTTVHCRHPVSCILWKSEYSGKKQAHHHTGHFLVVISPRLGWSVTSFPKLP